jgi:hypothetical protein
LVLMPASQMVRVLVGFPSATGVLLRLLRRRDNRREVIKQLNAEKGDITTTVAMMALLSVQR